ncbi:MAG: lysophospholipid acyltransferase family protein [Actinomycetota bacterium]
MIPDGIGRFQRPVRRVLQPLVGRLWRFEVEGAEHIPTSGPAVLCPNHAAAIDSMFVPAALARDLIYVGKSEYLDDWKTRWLFPVLGMIPIDRRGGDHATAALDAARAVLERGGLFGIYPEGTRSRSGKLHKGHTGAARLAIETGAPIIPVGLSGTAAVQPVDSVVPKFRLPVTVRFGEPIDVGRYRHRVGDRTLYRELIDEVMYEIQALTGLEYVHSYAGKSAEATTAGVTDAVPVPAGRRGADPDGPTIARPSSSQVLAPAPLTPLGDLLPTG